MTSHNDRKRIQYTIQEPQKIRNHNRDVKNNPITSTKITSTTGGKTYQRNNPSVTHNLNANRPKLDHSIYF